MTFNPLVSILKENKLDGSNYLDWKRNLDIILTVDGHKFILTEPCPEIFHESTKEEREAHAKWVKADEMTKCYILTSGSNILQHQHKNIPIATDMIYSFNEMFGHHGRQARQKAMRAVLTMRMAEGDSMKDYVLKINGHPNELEVLGAQIDGISQVDIIIESLPKSVDQFRLNYNMNHKLYMLPELFNELMQAETVFKSDSLMHIAIVSSSKPKGGIKKKKKQGGHANGSGGA